MAVASFDGTIKEMPAPKRADVRYWYKEAVKVYRGALPDWQESFRNNVDISEEVIMFYLPNDAILMIARKRHLR
jgi:hypothetical protein